MKVNSINNQSPNQTKQNNTNFKGINGANVSAIASDLFLRSQESVSVGRFMMDTAINWAPKAAASRSKEDLAEQSFLEFVESGIFYAAVPILANTVLKNGLFKNMDQSNPAVKAGMVLSCAMVPVAEYTLSFAKNLFTLKTFNKSNFNNIADLDKTHTKEKEDKEQQERVEKSAYKHFKIAGALSALGIVAGLALATKGKDSQLGQKIANNILEPGKAIGDILQNKLNINDLNINKNDNLISKASKKFINFLKESEYCSLKFAESKVVDKKTGDTITKLGLSKGQLAATVITGIFGYINAAGDRGEMDKKEVMTRVPISGFYTIVGSDLFANTCYKRMNKNKEFKNVFETNKLGNPELKTIEKLKETAKNLAKINGTSEIDEFQNLEKRAAKAAGVPFLFSLFFMGFSLALFTRFTTQLRYNKKQKEEQQNNEAQAINNSSLVFGKNIPNIKNFAVQNGTK